MQVLSESITFNHTTLLNLISEAVGLALVVVFFESGGPQMMEMMVDVERLHDGERHRHAHHERH